MGLLGFLIATVILILLLVFYGLPHITKSTPDNPNYTPSEAQEVMDTAVQRGQIEQNQIKDLNQPSLT